MFAFNLLHTSTDGTLDNDCPDVTFNYEGVLPGLLTTDKFDFNGTNGSWKEHGLAFVTWFAVQQWPNFPTGCNGVTTISDITSFPFESDLKTRTELYYGLFPYGN